MAAVVVALADPRDGDTDSVEGWRGDVRSRALARRPHEPERLQRLSRFAWLIALALHLVLIVSLRTALQDRGNPHALEQVMQVDLLDAPVAEPSLPLPPPSLRPATPLPQQRRTIVQQRPPVALPQVVPEAPAPVLRLFDEGGAAALPHDIVSQLDSRQPRPDFVARRYDPSPVMQPRRPLKVRPNHFAAAWAGSDGKPLSETIWEPVTFVTRFQAPWGGHYACALVLILFACGDIPDQPWEAPHTWTPASVLDEQ